jgi:hypothetical protein
MRLDWCDGAVLASVKRHLCEGANHLPFTANHRRMLMQNKIIVCIGG